MTPIGSRRARFVVMLLALTTFSGCSPGERGFESSRAGHPVRFQVVAVGYSTWSSWETSTKLDVREYACAEGDSFGGGRPPNCCESEGPFVFIAATSESTALVRYPSCLSVLKGWSCAPLPLDSSLASGPDTLTVSTNWSHFGTHVTDGGCLYSVRVMRSTREVRDP